MKGLVFMLVFLFVTSVISYSQTQKDRQNKRRADTASRRADTLNNRGTKDTTDLHRHYDNLNKRAGLK